MPLRRKDKPLFYGVYGNAYGLFLKSRSPEFFHKLEEKGELQEYLANIQEKQEKRADELLKKYSKELGIDDWLRGADYLEYLRRIFKAQELVREDLLGGLKEK